MNAITEETMNVNVKPMLLSLFTSIDVAHKVEVKFQIAINVHQTLVK